MEDKIKQILQTIDKSINDFQDNIPAIQRLILDELQPVLKQFDIKNGHLLNNVQNLKLLGTLKNKLQKVILNPKYKKAVEGFIDSFDQVAKLQVDYFSRFADKFTPSKTLPIIKDLAIETTINDLMGQGMNALVIGSVEEILRQNITTGGSYLDLQRELENHILDNYTGQGSLNKYTRQITTDAINQYSAQYHEAIAQDLNFVWGRYVGSLLTTSREFCIYMVKLEWFHKDQLPEILKGNIDGHQCKLSKTTGIPLGMIPGTTPENFKIRRGGYLCGHQVFWVPDSAVPEHIKNKFENKPAAQKPAAPLPDEKLNPIAKAVIENNKEQFAKWRKKGYEIDESLFNLLGKEITFKSTREVNAYHVPSTNQVVIGALGRRLERPYFRKMLFAHEVGHAIHNTRNIITSKVISEGFKTHFKELQDILKGKESDLHDQIMSKRSGGMTDDQYEQIATVADILASLTGGKYGYGHTKSYYRNFSKPEAEVFAHGISLMKTGNEFSSITPEVEQIIKKMIEYSRGIQGL